MKKRRLVLVFVFLLIASLFTGCSQVDSIKVKLGLKNKDFEYIKQGRVKKVVIQNSRDRGYKFVVTNPVAISELYDILSDAKSVDSKSSLDPDYIFSLYEDSNKVHEFDYVVGLDKKDGGNLYSKDKYYIVPSRIDNDILSNFTDLRTPKDFNKLYYTFISQCIDKYREDTKNSNKSIGVNVNDDVDVAKYIFSYDLDDFQKSLPSSVKLIKNGNDTSCDVNETVITTGYKAGQYKYNNNTYDSIYKSTVTFYDNKTKDSKIYYMIARYKNGWYITISDKKSSDF
ncbi:hypothetical protein [Clostridium sp.]|uniref:hypothetical protein n=1 Tax=Clostridium sp. TaxID=1506 RepID=UPI002588FEC0|nr:hypothetical protein [Clostridium sp.]